MRLGYGGHWLDRVTDAIEPSPGLTVIAAPPGFGVSLLGDRLRAHPTLPRNKQRDCEHRRFAVLSDLKDSEVHPSVNGALESDARVVLLGRSIPESVRHQASQFVDHSTMRLTEEEALDLASERMVSAAVARAIFVFTEGWPAYFLSCVVAASGARIDSATEAYDLLRTGPHLGNLVRSSLDSLEATDRNKIAQLAHFGRISQRLIESMLGPNGAIRVQAAGLPLVETRPGWYEILTPVSQILRSEADLDEQTASELAPAVVSDVGVVAGARLFLEAHQPAAAATALRSVHLSQLDEGSQASLLPVLRTVLDTEKDDGSLGLRLARVLHNHGDLGQQRAALVDAATSASEQLRPDLAIEAEAEILLLDLHTAEPEIAIARHTELLQEARFHSSSLAQIRLREVEVFLSTESGELAKIYRSVGQLESVAHEWAVVGEPSRAAATLRVLSTTSLFYLGRYAHAQDSLQRACDLSKGQPQSLAKSVTLLARMTALMGDAERFEALHERARALQESAGLAWVDAYLAWSEMIAAGYRQVPNDVVSSRRRAESLLGTLLDHETGTVFMADAAAAHAMAGDVDQALEVLDQTRSRAHQSPLEVGFAEIFVRSRAGFDIESLAEDLRRRVDVPVERDWRIDLEIALACADTSLFERVSVEAARHGLSELFNAIVHTSNHMGRSETVRVELLGQFRVTVDGVDKTVSSGKALDLIKFLAIRSRSVPIDVVIDHLWGDVSTTVGSRRLKNVVARAREIIGGDAIERTGQLIGLNGAVETDLNELSTELKAFRRSDNRDSDAAIRVVTTYTGPLLEVDLYEDWLDLERRNYSKAAASALDRVVSVGAKPASWAFDAQCRIDPTDDLGYMAIAELANEQGHMPALQQSLETVERICRVLEVDLPDRYHELTAHR